MWFILCYSTSWENKRREINRMNGWGESACVCCLQIKQISFSCLCLIIIFHHSDCFSTLHYNENKNYMEFVWKVQNIFFYILFADKFATIFLSFCLILIKYSESNSAKCATTWKKIMSSLCVFFDDSQTRTYFDFEACDSLNK